MKAHLSTRSTFALALSAAVALTACGGAESQKVSGIVSADASVSSVSLKDSSVPAMERTSVADPDGNFSFDVNGLTPPFMLSAVDASGNQLAALAPAAGVTNIDALTTAACFVASDGLEMGDRSASYSSVLRKLRTVLAPLFDHYGLKFGDDWDESRAFRTMLKEVSFSVASGQFKVTNKATGGVIYSAPLNAITSGVLHPENIPGGTGTTTPPPTTIDGAALYAAKCAGCHGPLATSSKKGRTAAQITAANMTQGLSAAEVQAVAAALAVSTPPPPAACSYTYSAWGACQSNGTQTRTVIASTPSGCTGTPVLSQSCTYTPPVIDGAALYAAKCAGCHGPLATSSKRGRTAAQITAANMTQGLSAAEVQAVAAALAVATPPPPVACTYTTGAWGACQPNGTQTRTVTASPSGCTGTPPAATQSCTYVPPVVTCTSFTYSAWGTCSASGTQTRTVVASSPPGCTGGSPVLSQACTPPAIDGAALYAAKCSGCHGPLATSSKLGRTAAQITAANMTQGLSAAQVQAVAAALAVSSPPPTTLDGTALYNQYCSSCHGSGMKGKSASTIQSAINSVGAMSSLKTLTSAQIQAISTAK